ncbi:hypothetical protein KC366_g54 [Hortaea werneckii]|nr:hypothetical protein KC366_g54 [Hortaea werneckii]
MSPRSAFCSETVASFSTTSSSSSTDLCRPLFSFHGPNWVQGFGMGTMGLGGKTGLRLTALPLVKLPRLPRHTRWWERLPTAHGLLLAACCGPCSVWRSTCRDLALLMAFHDQFLAAVVAAAVAAIISKLSRVSVPSVSSGVVAVAVVGDTRSLISLTASNASLREGWAVKDTRERHFLG